MQVSTGRAAAIAAAFLLTTGILAGCSSSSSSPASGTTSAANGPTGDSPASASAPAGGASAGGASDASTASIGLLLPNTTVPRYESADKPYFEAKVKELCPGCKVLYANANADASKQQQQAESMLSQGIKVLALDAVDTKAAAAIVTEAKSKNVPVISYARLINSPGLSFFSSSADDLVGGLQAQSLLDNLKAAGVQPGDGGILMINGDATDSAAVTFKVGAHQVIDPSGYKVLAEFDNWDPAKVQDWVAGQITKFGSKIKAVYSANDGDAGGAIAALKAAGVSPVPPVTGLDADLDGLQRILLGDQYETVYVPLKPMAEAAATAAISLANGETPKGATTVKGGDGADIQSFLVTPISVTSKNIETTVVKDGFHTAAEICTADYSAACAKTGVK